MRQVAVSTNSSPVYRRWRVVLLAGALLVVGSWPYLSGLGYQPMTSDAAIWIARGATDQGDWVGWTLFSPHFAGYRPLAALSYTLNYVTSGYAPFGYRAVDLVLHGAVACLVFVLYRRLYREGTQWGGWIAASLFLAHPLVERVVPYLARRSYSLSTVLTLAALIVIWDSLDVEDSRLTKRSWLGAGLLGLALLSNETAFASAGLIPMLAFYRFGFRRERLVDVVKVCVLPAAVTLVVFGLRSWILGGLGGYATDAQLRGGALTASTYTGFLAGPWWQKTWGIPAAAVGAAALLYYMWRAVRSYRKDDGLWRLTALLVAWILGFVIVSLISGTWFYRQLYPPLVPFSLLVGAMFAASWPIRSTTVARPTNKAAILHVILQVLLIAGVLASSPLIRGTSLERMTDWREQNRLLQDLWKSVGSVPEPAKVLLVLGYSKPRRGKALGPPQRVTELPVIWTRTRLGEREIEIESFAFYQRDPSRPAAKPALDRDGLRLTMPAGMRFQLGRDKRSVLRDSETSLRLDHAVASDGQNLYVYIESGGSGELLRIR